MPKDLRIAVVLGTRPEIIKFHSVLMEARQREIPVILIHTGQHYDFLMSGIFFGELEIPNPTYFLSVGSGTHGEQMGEGMRRIEAVLLREQPHLVVVQGDTNSTLAGALASIKVGIPVAHVEAGIRSFDWSMPEETNRRVVDAIASFCFAPTHRAFRNLVREGRGEAAYEVGDTLVEVSRPQAARAMETSSILHRLMLQRRSYCVATIHRSENVDEPERLRSITAALMQIGHPIVFPIHPRTRRRAEELGLLSKLPEAVRLIEPLGYQDFLCLLGHAKVAITDSGGVQQEAAILDVPCVTVRYNTEWIETLEASKNILVGAEEDRIVEAVRRIWEDERLYRQMVNGPCPFKEGAAKAILDLILRAHGEGSLTVPQSDFLRDGVPPLP